jgi:putative PIN family toxin of toxin-antitoxin system
VVYSRSTLNELISTLFYEKFDKYLTITDQQKFLESYINLAKDVKVTASISKCRDVKDNNFLELAVDGELILLLQEIKIY